MANEMVYWSDVWKKFCFNYMFTINICKCL